MPDQTPPATLTAADVNAPTIRLRDLIRYCRGKLLDEQLIARLAALRDEYAALLSDAKLSGELPYSARRLESYDDLRVRLDQQAVELTALRAQVVTIREQTLKEALAAVKAEHLEDPQETDGDAGYEHAIGDAVNVLEALRQRDRPPTEGS